MSDSRIDPAYAGLVERLASWVEATIRDMVPARNYHLKRVRAVARREAEALVADIAEAGEVSKDRAIAAELARVSEDDRQYVLELACSIVRAPLRIEGLTRQQSRLVAVLQAARGRIVSHDALTSAVAMDPAEPCSADQVKVLVCKVRRRRPDLGEHIELAWGEGYRWTGDAAQKCTETPVHDGNTGGMTRRQPQ